MAVVTQTPAETAVVKKTRHESTFVRVSRYVAVRLLTLFVTVVIGIYLTIMIANMGGFVDQIMKGEIRERVTQSIAANPSMKQMDPTVRQKLIQDTIASEEKRMGLDVPIAIRNFRYLSNALTLRLGRAINMTSDAGSKQVRLIILERLPATLLLMGISQLFLFFSSILLALNLSRSYGNFWDRAVVALSPTSAVPPWFYGIFLILIFAALLKVLPFGGMVDSPPPSNSFDYVMSFLKHLILPSFSPRAQFIFSQYLQLQNLFPDLFQRRLCGDGKSQGTAHPRCGAALYPASHVAQYHHEFCTSDHHLVDGCNHHRNCFPLARFGPDLVSSGGFV